MSVSLYSARMVAVFPERPLVRLSLVELLRGVSRDELHAARYFVGALVLHQ